MAYKMMSFISIPKKSNGKAELGRHELKAMETNRRKDEGLSLRRDELSREMPVVSDSTQRKYVEIWREANQYFKEEYGIKSTAKIQPKHFRAFAYDAIDRGITLNSYNTYMAAMGKYGVVLNSANKTPKNFQAAIKETRPVAKEELPQKEQSRAYENPEHLHRNLSPDHKLIAQLQTEIGARVSEVLDVKYGRNLIVDGDKTFVKLTNTKGGRIRTQEVKGDLAQRLRDRITPQTPLKSDYKSYVKELRKSSRIEDIPYNGTHGFRWNYAQRRAEELHDKGVSPEEMLQTIALELGHSRASISLHYLR